MKRNHTFSSGTTAYLSDGNTESFPAKKKNIVDRMESVKGIGIIT